MTDPSDASRAARAAFIESACVPLDASHASGTLDRAQEILAAHPELAASDIHTAAILGDEHAVREFLARDPALATSTSAPRGWDALTHLCFSRYLRLDRARAAGFLGAARALLDAGANPNTGWFERDHQPEPVWESVLYGAAGVAHDEALTRLLLERGADPNDDEVPYHSPEGYENGAMQALVESGRVTTDNLAVMLVRKADWHDRDGLVWLLEHGADPNRRNRWGSSALHHAVRRDNSLGIIELMLDHGADAARSFDGRSAVELAARRGRSDLLDLFARRRVRAELSELAALIAACARGDEPAARALVAHSPELVRQLLSEGGTVLAEFAGNGNTEGVKVLLDLGVPVDASYTPADGYWGIAPRSTALHVAAWRARHATVKLLLERGGSPHARDAEGRTPLALAVRACVDSYWTRLRAPDSVRALLDAGASPAGIALPSGYAEVDELLR